MSYASGTLPAIGNTVALNGNGGMTHVVQIYPASGSTFSGLSVIFEVSPDGTNWFGVQAYGQGSGAAAPVTSGSNVTSLAAAASYLVPANGMQSRVRCTAAPTGTVNVRIDESPLPIGAVLPTPSIANSGILDVAPQASLSAATVDANGTALDFTTCCRTWGMQVVLAGSVNFTGGTITLQLSLDGTNWSAAVATFTIGSDTNKDMKFAVDKPARYARAVAASLTGGTLPTVTVRIAAAG